MAFTNYWPAIWNDISQAINNAWPEIAEWDRVLDAEKFDWEQRIRDGNLHFPFALVMTGDFNDYEYGPAASLWFEGEIAIWYVAQDTAADVAAELENKTALMLNELLTDTFQTIQMFPGFATNVSVDSAPNIHMLSQKLPATSGVIVFKTVVPGPLL